jgi:hypothetical protein
LNNSLNVYEDWVRALRAWRRDPTTDLSALPPLDETSFPRGTYQRFLHHLNEAINEFMKHWQAYFVAALSAAPNDQTRARALVDARTGLSQRLKLAEHPSFPKEIRDQLLAQAARDIKAIQTRLEEEAMHIASVSSVSTRPQRETTLRLIRNNALTAVLDSSFVFDEANDPVRPTEPAPRDSRASQPHALDDFVPRRPARRIFGTDSLE